MLTHTENEIKWLWLALAEGIGVHRVNILMKYYGDIETIWDEFNPNDSTIKGISRECRDALSKTKNLDYLSEVVARFEKMGIKTITRISSDYPFLLSQIDDPPLCIYVKGNLNCLDKTVSIVGTRKCTQYGLDTAFNLGRDLGNNGVTVISGGARGIDSSAHKGCLAGNGVTVAVLGCGVDIVYPRENGKLYDKILEKGAIVSEYMPGMPPLATHFPARNRIISGLSSGVVVVESGVKSGAHFTVNFASEQGRDVFAVPGHVDSYASKGTNALIKDGAKILTSYIDILNEYNWEPKTHKKIANNVNPDEKIIVDLIIKNQSISMDDLENLTGFDISKLNSLLTLLEIRGIIKQAPGKFFSLI